MIKVFCVCGARPNFMKIAPVVAAFQDTGRIQSTIVHTGQHYDENMSRLFFDQLGIPRPDVNLEVGSSSHALQTANIMERFEPLCLQHKPDWVVVVGDVNSTIACALVAVKLGIRVAHVESGLRSFDRTMPEEINRLLTDAISDALFVTEQSGLDNLRSEGIPDQKVHFVGNVMIDTLMKHREQADKSAILSELGLEPQAYAVLTLHRPSNVDDVNVFGGILDALEMIAAELPIVFPMHPRTRSNIQRIGLEERVKGIERLNVIDPLGYLPFLKLMSESALVLTDSGGMQEETTILSVPCLTLRENTERPVTITQGTNRLVGCSKDRIVAAFREVRGSARTDVRVPELWDGQAARRIARRLLEVHDLMDGRACAGSPDDE
ncbi:MAG: UDP-N-acetylglucosamine 2-epimerase (non-hydrolyzing) [Phycisphaerales bacterium]|nr:MAG: UDP-N-acetylglucosamine 2-epimerase (non-hydrolyzing) [Phycisphaerales bacterium]